MFARCRERPLWRSVFRGWILGRGSRNARDGVPYRGWIVAYPINALLNKHLVPFVTDRNVNPLALAVDDFRLIPLGVDLQLERVGRLLRREFADDLHRLAGC